MADLPETEMADAEAHAPAAAIGPSLRQARERLALSVEDVASHLRLSPRQIHALESDEFSALPEATITRGFIRNYARLLEIPAEPLLETYRAYTPAGEPRAISIQSANILISGGDKRPWLAYIVASLVIAALLGAWLLYFEYPRSIPAQQAQQTPASETEESSQVSEPLPIAALPAAERTAETVTSSEAAPEQVAMPPAQPAAAIAVPPAVEVAAPVPPAAAGMAKLTMHFSEQTWINVLDRNDKELINKNKPAGSDEVIEAAPPLKLVIGNAAATTLTFNGKPVDLGPHSKLNVARITLE